MINSPQVDAADGCFRCLGPGTIRVISSPDGPVLIRGAELLRDQHGNDHQVRRPVVALCRCGSSTHPPWCDGMHKLLQRRDRSEPAW